MTIRHRAFKQPLDKGFSSEWNDDHVVDLSNYLTFYDCFYNDALAPWWNTAQSTGSGAVTTDMVDNHLFLTVRSGGTATSIGSVRFGNDNCTNRLDLPIFTASVRLDTTRKLEFGFFAAATAPFTANQNGAYFRVSNGVIYAVTGTGAAETVTSLGTPSLYGVYKIEFTSTNVKFYIDNMREPRAIHTTNLPSVDLTFKFSAQRELGEEQILRCDGVGLQRLRKK